MKKIYLTLVTLFIITGCQKGKEENNSKMETIKQEVMAETKTEKNTDTPNKYQKTAFYFKVPDYKGGEIKLEDYQGKSVLVKFFTRDCPYCQKAAPFIEKIYEKYNDKGLGVIGISVRDDREDAADFAQMFNLKYHIGYKGGETSRKYGIRGVPFIYLLDKNHELVQTWPGYDESYDKEIERAIQKILK